MSTNRNASAESARGKLSDRCCSDAPRLRSTDLFRGDRRVIIEHGGEQYCLRLTRNERLILNKI